MLAARRRKMARSGFPEHARVRVLRDSHPSIPAFAGFREGDEGDVILNMAHTDDDPNVCVRFELGRTPHSIAPEHLVVVSERLTADAWTPDDYPISVRERRQDHGRGPLFYDVFVGGARVTSVKTRAGADRRVALEASRPVLG
jgi:hypothetical protein